MVVRYLPIHGTGGVEFPAFTTEAPGVTQLAYERPSPASAGFIVKNTGESGGAYFRARKTVSGALRADLTFLIKPGPDDHRALISHYDVEVDDSVDLTLDAAVGARFRGWVPTGWEVELGHFGPNDESGIALSDTGASDSRDTLAWRHAEGEWAINGGLTLPTAGKGITLTSPDGQTTRTIGIDNSGEIVALP